MVWDDRWNTIANPNLTVGNISNRLEEGGE